MKVDLWVCEHCGWAGTIPGLSPAKVVKDGETVEVTTDADGCVVKFEVHVCPVCGVALKVDKEQRR